MCLSGGLVQKCLLFVWLAVSTALLCQGAENSRQTASRLYQEGEHAAKSGDSFKAYLLYSQAARLDPSNSLYQQRRAALQNTPLLNGTNVMAGPAMTKDSANETITAKLQAEGLTHGEMMEADEALPPVVLTGQPGLHSFDIRGDGRAIFEQVAASYGIQVVFDAGYQPLGNLRYQATGVGYRDALRIAETVTNSFLVPITSDVAMVARDTPQNRTQFSPAMSVVVPVPQRISVQEAQELATVVQQSLEIRRISLDPVKRAVYFRDSVPKVLAAREMFSNLSRTRAQVEVEVELLSVSRNSALTYGLSLPTSANIVNFGSVPVPLSELNAGGWLAHLALGIADGTIFGTLAKSSSQTLLRSQLVALDGQPASLHVGDRYPVITGSYTAGPALPPAATGTTTPLPTDGTPAPVPLPPPSITYVDLGVVLKVTPVVHEGGEVTLDVDAEFKTLGPIVANGIPSIGSRQYQGKVRLKNGEWAILAGLVSTNDSDITSGIAGLTGLPGIGKALSKQTRNRESSDTIIVLRPRLIAQPPWEEMTRSLWLGTGTQPITPF
jgi:general secretion pathway protein D